MLLPQCVNASEGKAPGAYKSTGPRTNNNAPRPEVRLQGKGTRSMACLLQDFTNFLKLLEGDKVMTCLVHCLPHIAMGSDIDCDQPNFTMLQATTVTTPLLLLLLLLLIGLHPCYNSAPSAT